MDEQTESLADFETVHDFLNERLILKIIGLFNVMRKPTLHFIINILYIGCAYILIVYIMSLCIYSLTIPKKTAAFKVQVAENLILMSLMFVGPMLQLYYWKNYKSAINLLSNGLNKYVDEEPDAQHTKLKKLRVKQTRLWTFIFSVLCYLVIIIYTLRPPISYIFDFHVERSNDNVNYNLPLALYVPFNTTTILGYTIAFLSNILYLFLLYTTLSCFVETYLSVTLQLVAQIEIFNYSLLNIQNRASLKYKLDNMIRLNNSTEWGDSQEEQKYLYMCLRTSLQHHQAINRYYQEIKEYLGSANTHCLFVFALINASSIVTIIKDPLGNPALIVYLLNELTGYFQVFLVGQVITDTSTDSMHSLYSTPWIRFNKSSNVMLNIMLTFAKKPIMLRAPFFNADWTLETFGMMISASYKLVNVLLNFV